MASTNSIASASSAQDANHACVVSDTPLMALYAGVFAGRAANALAAGAQDEAEFWSDLVAEVMLDMNFKTHQKGGV